MNIVNLPPGQLAAPETDCIMLNLLPDGRVRLECSALDQEVSVAVVGASLYASEAEAEAAGLAWAEEHGVQTLHVGRIQAAR